jgi:hypothetical protein
MQEPKHSEVREKQFLSKPTAKRPKLTEGQHKSKFDLSHHSKFLNRFSLWGAVFLFYWTFAIYGWRVMFFHFSVERKVLAKHSRTPKTISPPPSLPTIVEIPLQSITSATKPKPEISRPKPVDPEEPSRPTAHLNIQTLLQPQGQNLKLHLSQKKRTSLQVAAKANQISSVAIS